MQDEMFDKCKLDVCTRGPLITDNDAGEILCSSCGQVLIEKIDSVGPELRSFDLEQFNDKSRTGAKSSLAIHDMGLATTIGSQDKDASGNSLSGYMKNTFNRLRIWDSRSKSKGNDSNLRKAFVLLDTMKSQLSLPDNVIEETAYIYRKAAALKLTRGRGISSILYAALYAACRKTATPRTLRDIAKAGNIRKGDLATAYRTMVKSLDLKLEPYDPVEFVTKICSMINVSESTRRNALNLLLKSEDAGFSIGKNPMSLVAAAVYLATCTTNEKKTQVEIAKVCGVSNVSVRNLTKLFKVKLGLVIEE
ncbi:transcription initiation factor IIB [Candidatus Nitrosotalea bavarica]|uniref:transcription initiation factor IIB n=1 Tax=Candidatus Nitrosotalea bavarica TaxID=1903277 RepID=UPI001FE3C85F|nr:transcription initiation factor IIB [Candidatus Nitrosotalea bavarica]